MADRKTENTELTNTLRREMDKQRDHDAELARSNARAAKAESTANAARATAEAKPFVVYGWGYTCPHGRRPGYYCGSCGHTI